MTYFGFPRGRRKALPTVRIVTSSGVSTLYKDSSSPTVITPTYTTSSWTELFAAVDVTTAINVIEIMDSTGNTARIGTGGSGLEQDFMLVTPGGNGVVPVRIDANTRIVIRPLVSVVDNTETIINFYD
jgi:hypothetical protein